MVSETNGVVAAEASEPGRGRSARTPNEIPAKGLRDVAWRVFTGAMEERVTLIAAGVAFYLMLALFPALGGLVFVYGLVADPVTMAKHIAFAADILPPGGFDIIVAQLNALVQARTSSLSIGVFAGFAVALWSTNNAVKAIFDALNVVYGETEKRGIIRLNLMSLTFTGFALLFAAVLILVIGGVPALLSYLWLDRWQETLIRIVRWPLVLLFVGVGVAMAYRFGPSREKAKGRWLTWGAVFSTLVWFLISLSFSIYLQTFANYQATYGALATLIGFMIWIWLAAITVIIGGKLNAELEHQTVRDTTTGVSLPMGERGAFVADTVGEVID
ncbi:YihY/virulence factor BrkB family protein [Pararhizobium arenae]|uniref:YihY/virulence factor BrkB family protein n=1 Tax=Pararhizobium arenae TaxID=1856850 RepID=UPI00094B7349|nr:YihY/virulence factor BrkB family protein [Pararhizobium arenae]